ncbi:competence protein A [mine drainage metagenome]|uniref:Competence protein A n=1 Tax=mine drainage metagenome TaxID=410659 RepID=A0A1J5RL00_9ZZZZ
MLQRVFASLWRSVAGREPYDIGMLIGQEMLHLMQLRPGTAGPVILAATSISHESSRDDLIANPLRLKSLIKRAFAEQPFHGSRVVTCLPSDHVRMLLLNYTVAEGASESDSVIHELRQRVHEELDGMVVDFIPVRQEHPSPSKEAIVAMAARNKVMDYLDMMSRAGLQVTALDVVPIALARLMSWINAAETTAFPNLLLINFGSLNSYLTVIWGRRLMLDRPVEFSEQRLLSRLKNILDIAEPEGMHLLLEHGLGTSAESDDGNEISHTLKEVLRPEFAALKAEVNKTLVYTASRTHGRSIDGIYVVGSIAHYPGIHDLLREQFSVPPKILDPCSIFEHHLTDKELSWLRPHSGVAAATGLALRGVPILWPTSI